MGSLLLPLYHLSQACWLQLLPFSIQQRVFLVLVLVLDDAQEMIVTNNHVLLSTLTMAMVVHRQ